MAQKNDDVAAKVVYRMSGSSSKMILSPLPAMNASRNGQRDMKTVKKLSVEEVIRLIKSRTKLNRYFNTKGIDRNTAWEMVLQDCSISGINSKELAVKWRSLLASYTRIQPKANDQKQLWPYYNLMHDFVTKYQVTDDKLDAELEDKPHNVSVSTPTSISTLKTNLIKRGETPRDYTPTNTSATKRGISKESPATPNNPPKRMLTTNNGPSTVTPQLKQRTSSIQPKSITTSTPVTNSITTTNTMSARKSANSNSNSSTNNNNITNSNNNNNTASNDKLQVVEADNTVVLSDDEDDGVTTTRRNGQIFTNDLGLDTPEAINRIDAKIDAFIDDLQRRSVEMSKKFNKTCEAISNILKERFDVHISDASETD